MLFQIDERLAAFSANLWKPLQAQPDRECVPPQIAENGSLSLNSVPLEGPETDNERFFTMIWNCAKPSRWFKPRDFVASVRVNSNGSLAGDIGFSFRFVENEEDADFKTTFVPLWGLD